MKTAVTALTEKGSELAVKLGMALDADVFIKPEFIRAGNRTIFPINNDFMDFTGEIFAEYRNLIFIMACGIVVRAIAPHIRDKRTDPAVIVLDEKGQHVISLLSGHLGGANALAVKIAALIGGIPVITTATDINQIISFDVFAKENGGIIENMEELKYIGSELVNGGKVGLYPECVIEGELPDNIVLLDSAGEAVLRYTVIISNRSDSSFVRENALIIRPRNLILGLGCKRGTEKEEIKTAVDDFMKSCGKSILSLKYISTVDLKKDEKGLKEYCSGMGLELRIVAREEIKKVENDFTASRFVKNSIGVSSVAEPCAVLAGENARLICGKTVYKGITLALAEEEKTFSL